MTVTEYRDRFLQLARYAPAEVAHDGDKQERFREGLDDHLEYALMNHRFDNFNSWLTLLSTPSASARRLRTRRGRWLLLRLVATPGLGTSTTSSSRGRSSSTSSDSSSIRLVLSSSSRRDRVRGFQRLRHALLHPLRQPRGKECLLLLPGSRLQHSHECASIMASRGTTPTSVPGRRSLDSRDAQLSPRRHPRAG
jgi:hypothetical protein